MIKTTLRIALTPAILIVRLLLGRVYPEFCVNVLRKCKQQKLV